MNTTEGPIIMHRNVISLTSVLALFVGFAGLTDISQAHEGTKQCNVLLDGDGEPVKETDSDDVGHSNSYACASDSDVKQEASDSVDAPVEDAPQQAAEVTAAPVAVEPLTVYFDVSRDKLSAGSNAQIQAFADQLQATNPKSIKVVGYTDTSGSAALNQQLSKSRASNVIASLVDAGISNSLIVQDSAGEDTLAVETPDATREPNNRRVVITPEY